MTSKAERAEALREYLRYEPETGHFYWIRKPARFLSAGDRAGSINGHGYRQIGFRRENFQEHRLAWFFVHGVWPDAQVDHRDLDRTNNAIANLRLASASQNRANSASRSARKSSPLKGVTLHRDTGKFQAQIFVLGRHIHLGLHDTAESAHAAYCKAAVEHFGEFARVQ